MSELPLPQWAYVPGETYEADADYETLAQVKLLVPPAFRGYVPARLPDVSTCHLTGQRSVGRLSLALSVSRLRAAHAMNQNAYLFDFGWTRPSTCIIVHIS